MRNSFEFWTVKWIGGVSGDHWMFDNLRPVLFKTRAEARRWAEEKYAYIKTRRDLRIAPHFWRMPKTVRVTVTIRPVSPSENKTGK